MKCLSRQDLNFFNLLFSDISGIIILNSKKFGMPKMFSWKKNMRKSFFFKLKFWQGNKYIAKKIAR